MTMINDLSGNPVITCPWCDTVHDGMGGVDTTERPDEGSTLICTACGRISIFESPVKVRRATPQEMVNLLTDDKNVSAAYMSVQMLLLREREYGRQHDKPKARS